MSGVVAGSSERERPDPTSPAGALRDALNGENWEEVPPIIESYWGLLFMRHLPLLREAYAKTPASTFDRHPVARTVQEIAHRALPPSPASALLGQLPADDDELLALADSDEAASAVVAAVVGMISARLRTEWDHARDRADRLVVFVDQVAHSNFDTVSRWMPGIHMEVGITYLMAGDLVAAERHLRRAWIESDFDNIGHVASGASSRLALVHALAGDVTQAEHWIGISRATAIPPEVAEVSTARETQAVAQALIAVARLDPAAAKEAEAAMVTRPGYFEQWSMWMHARAQLGLVRGDLMGARRVLAESEASQPYVRTPPPFMQEHLLADQIDLLIASGSATNALRLLLDHPDGGPRLKVALGRLRLLCGDDTGALSAVQPALGGDGAGPDVATEALVVSAMAHHRLGGVARATADLEAAVVLAEGSGCVWGFGTVPRSELEQLALVADVEIPDVGPKVFPDSVEVIELSSRQRAVLQHLATGKSASEIAATDYVSINTVKTQVASLYRKLGSKSRDEALQRARDAGILSP